MAIFKLRPRPTDSQGKDIERRYTERLIPSDLPALKSTRLLAGPDVRLINISRGGALFESGKRISPGANVCIRLIVTDALIFLRGHVLQSRASSLQGSGLIYQCRIAFDEEFPLLPERREEPAAASGSSGDSLIEDIFKTDESWLGTLEEGPKATLTVTVPVPRLECDLPYVFGQPSPGKS